MTILRLKEDPSTEKPLKLFHPVHTYKMKFIKSFEAKDLHHTIFEAGKLVYQLLANGSSGIFN